ncbi:RNA polymerase sigma factor [Hyalangium versicolor]|uniref:RNA polymerase sigma factor n=1 Tax=Hyalangium versicolor TaxID=2861190 RepID=UPI001CC9630E|nr:RNA polymerase sigma factor [Hyalangium versicolor]
MDSRHFPPSAPDSAWFAANAPEHEPVLRAAALKLCRNASEASDLVQETFKRGLEKLGGYKRGTDFRAWLLSILRNLFIDQCRSSARGQRADVSAEDLQERVAAPEPEAQPAWAAISPEQLREALEQIPEEFRLVYQLHSLEGRSYIEISERLGIPKATVGTRLIRARRRLKELLLPVVSGGEA